MINSESEEVVELSVSGVTVSTLLSTLRKVSNSRLAKIFGEDNEEWRDTIQKTSSGAFFIDAEPKYFLPVLNFLRRDVFIPDPAISTEGVLAEARYFGITPLIEALTGSKELTATDKQQNQLLWKSIGGLSGVKRELQQVVEHVVKYKDRFDRLGVAPSKNVLLYGPPGCGKTLLARATAAELKANFHLVKCPEILTAGESAALMIQEQFTKARALQPCVLFFEEFECIAATRGNNDIISDGLISQLAIALDSISRASMVFVFAATNRPERLEPALLRPGRFDQLIYIPMPDKRAREEILRAALHQVPLPDDVDLTYLAHHTHGLSGADLVEICQRACKFAIRRSIEAGTEEVKITRRHFEAAMGFSRRSVSDVDVYRYEHFNRLLQQISNPSFSFPSNRRRSHSHASSAKVLPTKNSFPKDCNNRASSSTSSRNETMSSPEVGSCSGNSTQSSNAQYPQGTSSFLAPKSRHSMPTFSSNHSFRNNTVSFHSSPSEASPESPNDDEE